MLPASEARWVRKARKASPGPLGPRVLSVKPVRLGHKVPPVWLVLPVPKVLQVLPGLLAHRDPLAKPGPLVLKDLPV